MFSGTLNSVGDHLRLSGIIMHHGFHLSEHLVYLVAHQQSAAIYRRTLELLKQILRHAKIRNDFFAEGRALQ